MVYAIQRRGRWGGRVLRNGRAIVLQWDMLCRWGGVNKRMTDSHDKALSFYPTSTGRCLTDLVGGKENECNEVEILVGYVTHSQTSH